MKNNNYKNPTDKEISSYVEEGLNKFGIDLFNQMQMAKMAAGFTALLEMLRENNIIDSKEFERRQLKYMKDTLEHSLKNIDFTGLKKEIKKEKRDYIG